MTMTENATPYTDWFPPEITPVHAGDYQTELPKFFHLRVRIHWDGAQWVSKLTGRRCKNQNLKWRGFSANPQLEEKAKNPCAVRKHSATLTALRNHWETFLSA